LLNRGRRQQFDGASGRDKLLSRRVVDRQRAFEVWGQQSEQRMPSRQLPMHRDTERLDVEMRSGQMGHSFVKGAVWLTRHNAGNSG
jgi:hypothetical protein